MATVPLIVRASLVWMVSCRPLAPVVPTPSTPQLARTEGQLYVHEVPPGLNRGTLLIVQSRSSLPGRALAIVQVTDRFSSGNSAAVAAWGPCSEIALAALEAEGLPVAPLQEDTQLRVGKCWGRAEPIDRSAWDPDAQHIDLQITLGSGDGVEPHDRFEVLGRPLASDENRVVEDHEKVAECTVDPLQLRVMRARCRVDRTQWKFTEERALQGAYVRFVPGPSAPGRRAPRSARP